MDEETMRIIIRRAREYGIKSISFSGLGEPLLHREFLKLAKMVKEEKFKFMLITNGTLLNENIVNGLIKIGIDRVVVSLHTLSPIKSREITKTDYFRFVIKNLNYLIKSAKGTDVGIDIFSTICKINDHEEDVLRTYFSKKNVNLTINYCHNRGGSLKDKDIIDEQFYASKGISVKEYNHSCRFPFEMLFYVDWRGFVLPCCMDFEGKTIVNLKENTLYDAEKILDTKYPIKNLCRNCNFPSVYEKQIIERPRFYDSTSYDLKYRYLYTVYDFLKPFIRGEVLDITCDDVGYFSQLFAKEANNVLSIMDSYKAVNSAREKNVFKNVKYIKKDLKSLSLIQKFDVISYVGTLEHLKCSGAKIKKLRGYLNDTGTLLIFVQKQESLSNDISHLIEAKLEYLRTTLASFPYMQIYGLCEISNNDSSNYTFLPLDLIPKTMVIRGYLSVSQKQVPTLNDFAPLVDVQIPAYRSKFLNDAILSIASQNSRRWKLSILVDGPPSDELLKIKRIISKYKNYPIEVMHQNNMGVAKTRKTLIESSNCKYIIPLDDDDFLCSSAVTTVIDKFQTETSLLRSGCLVLENKKRFYGERPWPRTFSNGLTLDPCNLLQLYCINREKYFLTEGINLLEGLPFGEDIDLFLKMEEVGKIQCIPDILYARRYHSKNQLDSISKNKLNKLLRTYMKNAAERRAKPRIRRNLNKWQNVSMRPTYFLKLTPLEINQFLTG